MKQADNVLAHFGIKGMKWGVRRDNPGRSLTSIEKKDIRRQEKANLTYLKGADREDTRVAQLRSGGKLHAGGGQHYPAHPDAVKTATSKQIAKGSSTDSLSTKDLQELVNRMNLEQQYSKLTTPQNKSTLKEGLKKVNQIMETKKTVDTLLKDPFIKEATSNLAQDLGLDKLILKGTRKAFGG